MYRKLRFGMQIYLYRNYFKIGKVATDLTNNDNRGERTDQRPGAKTLIMAHI